MLDIEAAMEGQGPDHFQNWIRQELEEFRRQTYEAYETGRYYASRVRRSSYR